MPVTKQLYPIPMTGGIDTKTDEKQVLAGQLLELKDGQFTRRGQISKRYGYDALNTNVEGGGTISAGAALSTYRDELALFDGSNVYSYVEATGNWLNRGTAVSVIATDKTIVRSSNDQQLNPDVAIASGVEVYAWEDDRGGVRYSVVDATTKTFCVADRQLSAFGTKPKCIALGNTVFILYTDAVNNLFYQTVNPLNPTVITVARTFVTDGSGDFVYDVTVNGSNVYAVYYNGTAVIASRFDSTGTRLSTATVETIGTIQAATIVTDGTSVWIVYATSTEVRAAVYSATLGVATLAPVSVATASVDTLTAVLQASVLTLVYEVHAAVAANHSISAVTISPAGTVTAIGSLRSVGLASKAFIQNGSVYVNTAYESALQSTYFTVMIGTSFAIVAKVSAGLGGGLRTNHLLSETVESSTGVFAWANLIRGKVITEANTIFSLLGVNATVLDFANPNRFLSTTQSGALLFVGGILQTYDGVSTVEVGFHTYPENITAVAAGSDGSLGAGTYQYCVTFEWSDNNGDVQRSAPSVPVSVTVAASNHVTLTIPTLRLTAKQSPRANPSIVIYRTELNGTLFNRCSSTIAPLENDPTVDSVQYVDVASDASIAANELLYTTGGVLSNQAPPACTLIANYQNRVILGGLEDENLLWFSKNRFDVSRSNTIPVEFAAENTLGCDPRGGAITALGVLDDKLVIFKRSAIFIVSGDGPNDTGGGSLYPDPQLITSDAGCTVSNSVVQTPVGLMFRSAKGIYMLDRSLNVTYIGAPVESFNANNITSATLNHDANQVVFACSDGPALVYDYLFAQWATWTNHLSEDTDVYSDQLVMLRSNGRVYRQNRDVFTDGGVPIVLDLTTPNLSFASLQGFQRVFRCYLLGTYKGPHDLTIDVAYDFNGTYTQTVTIPASQSVTVWGDGAVWGDAAVWGGTYSPYEFRIDFAQQRCTAIRLRIRDAQTSDYNEGYALSALTFEVGTMPGGNRTPTSRTYGTR